MFTDKSILHQFDVVDYFPYYTNGKEQRYYSLEKTKDGYVLVIYYFYDSVYQDVSPKEVRFLSKDFVEAKVLFEGVRRIYLTK